MSDALGGPMTADPTPEAIRQALDVLAHFGLDPDDARAHTEVAEACDRIARAVVAAVRKLDTPTPRPVTADTPAGTEIAQGGSWPDAVLMAHRTVIPGFVAEHPNGTVFTRSYADGWVEVRRPEPVPVQSDPGAGER